jgi:nitrite reductase/ring-hydroxylating ferredoxin subunit
MSAALRTLEPPRPLEQRLRYVPYAVDVWCPVAPSRALAAGAARSVELLGAPVALYRGAGGAPRALEDRCPHRGVALSLGRPRGDRLQCAYHGWTIDPDGAVAEIPGIDLAKIADGKPCVRSLAAREAAGLIWLFVGDPARAASTPLPDLAPFATGAAADLLLTLEVRAHWSLVLDNGLDLFHQHLHRDVPFFFQVHDLESFGPDGDRFRARYRATLRDATNRRRPGAIDLVLDGNVLHLDFDGFPIIHAIATPRSADGRRLTLFWLVAFPAGALKRLFLRAWMPVLRRQMLRGFRQDALVLESEQQAFDRDARAPQLEPNPVIHAAHRHLEAHIARRALEAAGEGARDLALVPTARDDLAARARRGEAAVLASRGGQLHLLDPESIAQVIETEAISLGRYHHFYVVPPP